MRASPPPRRRAGASRPAPRSRGRGGARAGGCRAVGARGRDPRGGPPGTSPPACPPNCPTTRRPRSSRSRVRSVSAAAAVISVGRNAVTPYGGSAAARARMSSTSAAIRSTPAKPLTCRSTSPGAAIRPPDAGGSPTSATTSPSRRTSPRTSSPSTRAAETPRVRLVMRLLLPSTGPGRPEPATRSRRGGHAAGLGRRSGSRPGVMRPSTRASRAPVAVVVAGQAVPGQEAEQRPQHDLLPVGRDAALVAGDERGRLDAAPEPLHQRRVAHSAAGDDDLRHAVRRDGARDGEHGQLGERREQVGPRDLGHAGRGRRRGSRPRRPRVRSRRAAAR